MTRPLVKPIRPEFSSGPCAKRPDWSLQALTKATVARSHRHKIAKQKLEKVIELTKSILEIPDNYFVGIVPGSDTGAIEMAMWNLLGPRPINILVWDSFGLDWARLPRRGDPGPPPSWTSPPFITLTTNVQHRKGASRHPPGSERGQ